MRAKITNTTQVSPRNVTEGPSRTCAQTVSPKGDLPPGFSRHTNSKTRIMPVGPARLPWQASSALVGHASSVPIDGHAVPSISVVTLFASTKLPKLMDTLCRASSALIDRASNTQTDRGLAHSFASSASCASIRMRILRPNNVSRRISLPCGRRGGRAKDLSARKASYPTYVAAPVIGLKTMRRSGKIFGCFSAQ